METASPCSFLRSLQRYKEIGIRIDLGATRQNILQLILARTLKFAAVGLFAGLITAFFLPKFLSTILC